MNSEELTVDDITSIQAYTDETVYGTGVVEVEITYREDATVPEDLTPRELYPRGPGHSESRLR